MTKKSLRALMATENPLIVPAVYDGISALAFKESGFKAAYIGSYGTGATKYGIPDIGYISAEDMADQVRRLAPVVDVPVIVDGEGGWGNPLHVARSTRLLERAGAAALHLEDHAFGKHITQKPSIIPVEDAVDKVKAALDARDSDDFLVIARTDSQRSLGGAEAVERLLAYQDAGADALFLAGTLSPEEWQAFVPEARVPIIVVDNPATSAADLAELGAGVVLYYALAHFSATAVLRAAYATLAAEGSTVSIEEWWKGLEGLLAYDSFLGIDEVRAKARQYGLIE
ncbi:oxaloacetate decarboxylase [Streptomyces sp. NPDC088387]|uniref:isocitrate lyase/PEP mutase family protein n=1 Tax=Streptomyces sp. NPDC088387 TaxID=3365859 RepID=UPI0037FAFD7F